MDWQWFIKNVLRMGPYSAILAVYSGFLYATSGIISISESTLYWVTIWALFAVLLIYWGKHIRDLNDA